MDRFMISLGCGIAIESILMAVFVLFPVGSCNQPWPGVVVICLHFPGIAIAYYVFRTGWSLQQFILAAVLMVPFWSALAYMLFLWLDSRRAS